jgi:hypothetical protein
MADNKNIDKTGDDKKFDSFVESIEEEIRSENWQKLWVKYGRVISYGVCTIIIAIGVYSMWQRQDLSDKEAISARYTIVQNMIMSGTSDDATIAQIREISNASKKNYATLAKFEHASLLRSKNDKRALTEYKSICDDHKADELLRDLAYIFYVTTCLDLMAAHEIVSEIGVFIETLKNKYNKNPWSLLASEALAFCYIKNGDTAAARQTLMELAKTRGIPDAMAARVKMLLNSLREQ